MNARAISRRELKRTLRHAAAAVGSIGGYRNRGRTLPPRVLCYHGVSPDPPDEWSITVDQLKAHVAMLVEGYQPISLSAVVDWLTEGAPLPDRAVAITFDDAFVDLAEHAAPVLADAGIPAAVFAPVALLGGASAPDHSYHPTRPFMSWEQLRGLHTAGWAVGSHALDHPVLSQLNEDDAAHQLTESKRLLEEGLGVPVDLLAYPYGTPGTVSERDRRLAAEAGYRAAFMDMTGPLGRNDDRWALPRTKVLGTDSLPVVRAAVRGDLDLWRYVERSH